MKKKLLVTGFGGFVAGSVITQARKDWEVYTVDRIAAPQAHDRINYYTLDLRDAVRLRELFNHINPNAVIHTAAIADIDFCQNHQEIAEEVNAGVTHNLAELCKGTGAKLVFCSTDTIFDGEKGFYTEEDQPNPINFYAETKVKAENLVKETVSNAVVTRLSLVMGLPVMEKGNSFLARMIEKLDAGEDVKFPENEIRTPIDVITLGRALLELAGNDFYGTLHLSGNDSFSRYKMARRIAIRLGYSPDLIIPTDSNAMAGRAPRPNDVSLNNSKAQTTLQTSMRNFREGLELTLNFSKESL